MGSVRSGSGRHLHKKQKCGLGSQTVLNLCSEAEAVEMIFGSAETGLAVVDVVMLIVGGGARRRGKRLDGRSKASGPAHEGGGVPKWTRSYQAHL